MHSYPVIDMHKTGQNLQLECEMREISAREIQNFLGLTGRQAIYSWFQGKTLPTLDNFYALSKYIGVSMEKLVVQKRENVEMEEDLMDEQPVRVDMHALERRQMAYFGGLLQMG